jgi:hypothetical protein
MLQDLIARFKLKNADSSRMLAPPQKTKKQLSVPKMAATHAPSGNSYDKY